MQRACARLSSVACPALQYLFTLFHKCHVFRKKIVKHKLCALIFSPSFAWKISHSRKNWARYDNIYRVFNLKVDHILIWVIYLLRFTCYITQLTCIYSKCWKWCPFISMHLSTRFTMSLATFLSVLSFFNHFRNSTFYWRLPSKFFKETLSTVGVRHRFLNNFPK